MSDTLRSGMSCSAVGGEFNINDSAIYILNKESLSRNTYKTRLCIDEVTKILSLEAHKRPNLVFTLGAMVHYSLTHFSWIPYRTFLPWTIRTDFTYKITVKINAMQEWLLVLGKCLLVFLYVQRADSVGVIFWERLGKVFLRI